MAAKKNIVGITERHGIALEYSQFPPENYRYEFLIPKQHIAEKLAKSSAKGFFRAFEDDHVDLVEAPIFPANTKKNWIYTPAEFTATANFTMYGVPLPRKIKLKWIEHVFKQDNFKKLVFKSKAGLTTLNSYAGLVDADVQSKATVVYPCVNVHEPESKKEKDKITILFVGDFFRKGGANVVDVFEQLQTEYPHIELMLIGSPRFDTSNQQLLDLYQQKIANNSAITHKRVPRDELVSTIYPYADIFVSPTYQETFGFAILEAMAFGLPVISTAHFAIPEIVDDGHSGLLITTDNFEFVQNFKGYEVTQIPRDFHQYMNEQLYERMAALIKAKSMREELSKNAIDKCRSKFSPQARAEKMKLIYDQALA